MPKSAAGSQRGEYAERGDYHRHLDEHWDYLPTYLAKMSLVRSLLDRLPAGTHVLDAGCGEGLLVEEYAGDLRIHGVDAHYVGHPVTAGSLTALPYAEGAFEQVLCLDVLEHLAFGDQAKAMEEICRVLKPGGRALLTIPNLAHLQSRVHFALMGKLMRTASLEKHPGDRPISEYLALARRVGFEVVGRRGIFPTVPILTSWIRRHPRDLAWLHAALTRLLPFPGWCFLAVIDLSKPAP